MAASSTAAQEAPSEKPRMTSKGPSEPQPCHGVTSFDSLSRILDRHPKPPPEVFWVYVCRVLIFQIPSQKVFGCLGYILSNHCMNITTCNILVRLFTVPP